MISHIYETLRIGASGGNPYIIVGLAFLAGIVTSFTPCLYPMIPITMGILQSQAASSVWANFLAAFSYVFGMAMVYAGLGYIAATTSIIFGRWASNPWFIVVVVAIFLYLAFSMFGFYEIYMPSFLTQRSEVAGRRPLIRCFLLGIISGSVASPCLTPPLAILLTLVAKKGNPYLGFAALFAFALGMGILLLVVGTFSSSLSLLPRAGTWMLEIKKIFGFIMLAMCVYIAGPIIGADWALYLYILIGVIMAGYYLIFFAQKKGALCATCQKK